MNLPTLVTALLLAFVSMHSSAQEPIVSDRLVFAETDGLLAVEAEHFFRQTGAETRAFYLVHSDLTPAIQPDGDPVHLAGASGGAYLEILPDSRRSHSDRLVKGENFSPRPGEMAVVHYRVNVKTPGRYYVWVRAFSTNSEDNGLHVGIDGRWPASGQRLQWCEGKNRWRWESRQRTQQNHCGEPHGIYLDIEEPGEHTIQFSMREDGFEFDKWLMTTKRGFPRPEGTGPDSVVSRGATPEAFAYVDPPQQAAGPQPTPARSPHSAESLTMPASMFYESQESDFYVDRGTWLAIDPKSHKQATAARTFPFPSGVYNLTILAVGENDGQSTYNISVDEQSVGEFECPLGASQHESGPQFSKTWRNVRVTEGAIIRVSSSIGSVDGSSFSRARWSGVKFTPADDATRRAALQYLEDQRDSSTRSKGGVDPGSPTIPVSQEPLHLPRRQDGDGEVSLAGDYKPWHKITLDLQGPYAHEQDNAPNPFTDYRMTVTFRHSSGRQYVVPGFFAADGDAGDTSAQDGVVWRAHFTPDLEGEWTYTVGFCGGELAALERSAGVQPIARFDGRTGSFTIRPAERAGSDPRARGRLNYVGKRYLRFAGSGEYFLKVGADAPETLLAYADFDNTVAGRPKKAPLKTWSAHEQDWRPGDPTWAGGKGKGLVGAINYLSGKGCNAFSFLTYNAGGDGDNVWPFIHRDDKLHYDCSKLDQWGVVFDHGTNRGMYLHFKMQETENDDHRTGARGDAGRVNVSLDGGDLGVQRKLYCRELIARFGHNLALNWNLGEENTQSTEQVQAMLNYIADTDPYDHLIVIHTFPNQQDKVYRPLIGERSRLTGVSLQNSSLPTTHAQTLKWVRASTKAGKPWVVAFDESGSAAHAQCPDLGYQGFDGRDRTGKMAHTQHEVRKETLWGTLMAGGAGCEYYFGYQFDQNDILCEDWRSRDQSWDYCRIAIQFFHEHRIPFWKMINADELVGNPDHAAGRFSFAAPGELYLVYLPDGGAAKLDLPGEGRSFSLEWFNPRSGGELQNGSVRTLVGGRKVSLGEPPSDAQHDWLAVVRAAEFGR